jgi:hypothetical protein
VDIYLIVLLIGAVFWAAVKAQGGKKYWGSLVLNLEVYVDMLIYLLTTVGLKPGGSSKVHIYTQTNI